MSHQTFGAETKGPGFFDAYISPRLMGTSGSYKVEGIEDGNELIVGPNLRFGFKIGPLLLGIEASDLASARTSSKTNLSAENNLKYAVNKSGKISQVGFNLGLMSDRVNLWYNYYPANTQTIELYSYPNKFDQKYEGSGAGAEIEFRVWDRLYLGARADKFIYNKYTSNNPANTFKDETLDPSINSTSYGITIGYFIPFSEAKGLSKILSGK